MAKGFQLTAELNLRGPSNIRQVVGGIRKQLQGINTNLNININKKNIQGMQQANTRLAAINKTLQTTVKNASNATAAFNKLSASMRSVGNVKISPNIASGMNNTTKSVVTTTKAVQQAKNEFEEFGKLGGLAIKRFAAFSVVTGAIYAVNNAISAGVKSFLEYDRQLTRVSQVLDTSRASLRGLDNSITALSTSLGVSSTELANVTVTLSQAGIQAADTRKALEALAKSALAPTFASLTNTTEGAIAAMRQFSISAGQLEGALGSINAVAGKFAVEASDIITAIQRTGGVFASASKGVSQGTAALNEFIAVFTSVRATSRESAETIATGLRTIFTRLQRQDTIDALKQFGVTLTDLEGKFVGPYKAIQLLSEGLRSLDTRDLKFAGIAEELGGFRQIGKVLPLIQQFGTAQQALNVAQRGSGSLSKDAAKGQLALAVQIQKVREEFTALVRSISDSSGFRTLLTVGLDLTRVFIGVADALKGVLPLLAGLGAIRGIGALAGFTKGFGGVFKKSQGGAIPRFARGGVVPGTGSGDTVPAMLQPGEFVIRKKAVETLGTKRLHKMNKFGNGKSVKKSQKPKDGWENLVPGGDVHFTHLDSGSTSGLPKGFRKVYTNMGLDLPANWNLNWAKGGGNQKDDKGADGKTLADYIRKNRVFGSLLRSGRGSKVYGFKGRSESKAFNILKDGEKALSDSLANQIAGTKKFDTDNQVSRSLPNKLKAAIKQTFTKKGEAKTLIDGFEEESAYTKEGKSGRRRLSNRKREMLKNNRALGGFIRGYASGGNVQDTVPAMLTPGEFVINKSSASKLGTRTLNKLNNADRIKGYNRGGFVGFANGGQAQARGSTLDTIGINPNDVALLVQVGDTLQQLGIQSSSSTDILEQGYQATYESAIQAAEADLKRAKAVGANTKDIEGNIQALKKQGGQAQTVSKALSGATGSQLQGLQSRLGRGQDIRKAASKEGIGGLANLAKAGGADLDSVTQYIAQAGRDRQTLLSMDQRLIKEKGAHLRALGKSDKEIKAALDEEIQIRRSAITENAASQGAAGPDSFGNRISKVTQNLGVGIGLLSSVASNLVEATSAGGAAMNAGIAGAGMTFGAGNIATSAVVDLLPTDQLKAFGGAIGLGVSAAVALGQGLMDARNAARQFNIDQAFKNTEKSMEAVDKAFVELEKDLDNINIQNTIEQKLVEAGDSLAKGLEIQNETAKMFWANAIDVITSGGDQASVERSQILETKGFFAYMRAGFDEQFRNDAIRDIQSTQRDDSIRRFQPLAAAVNKLVDTRAGRGESSDDIVRGANFEKLARTLAGADAATQELIQSIKDNTNITNAEKDARIKNITNIFAEQQIRQRVQVIARQKEIEALQKSTNVYTRSLERMYQNMEQSINAAGDALQKMQGQIDLNIASMQGQARIGDVVLDAISVLQNPRAFSDRRNQQATERASRAFGSQAGNMSALINLGEDIESAVMSSINSVLKADPNATNPAIEAEINKAVDATLADLGLPPELADKMATEVASALSELNREGGDTVDYAQLGEKLGSLNSVIDASKRAREIAIKVLEHQQKAMQQYTTNLNKVIDLEVSSRNYARKAVDILADAEIGLAKSLGKTIRVVDIINNREADLRRQTGLDAVDPTAIFKEIGRLETQRRTQQGVVNTVAQQGDRGTDDFVKFSNSVKDTSVQLRENIAALKDLAQNGDVAAAALNKIQEAQQSNAQKVGFFEKVVTSTPDELEGMNRAFIRLQRNLNGQVNTINQSVGAQKAYFDALKSGASQFEAMRAAQGAFAKERGESLSLLKDIMPFLGDSEQSGGIRATALESMLRESGVGINPMMQQVLNNLRNPQVDPAVQAAIQQYKAANVLQSEANRLLGQLDANLAQEVAANSEVAFRNALDSVTLDFEDQQLSDIAAGVNRIVTLMEGQNGGRQGLANGGVVYAAGGQQIFQPKGTDTVPAMLTPGEFVVNRQATQSNLPLLKNINNGYYAQGGLVTSWNNTSGFGSESRKEYLNVDKMLEKLRSNEVYTQEGVPNLFHQAPTSNIDGLTYPKDGSIKPPIDLQTMNLVGARSLKKQYGFVPATTFTGTGGSITKSSIGQKAWEAHAADMDNLFHLLPKHETQKIQEANLDAYKGKMREILANGYVSDAVRNEGALGGLAGRMVDMGGATAGPKVFNKNEIDHTAVEHPEKYIGIAPMGSVGWQGMANPVSETDPGYKVYKSNGLKELPDSGYPADKLLSVGAPAGNAYFNSSSRGISKDGNNTMAGSLPSMPKYTNQEMAKNKIEYTQKSLAEIQNTATAMGGGINFEQTTDGSKVQQQLEKLYDGTTAYERFDNANVFDNLPIEGINNLIVPGTDALKEAIEDKATESRMLIEEGLPRLKGIFGYTEAGLGMPGNDLFNVLPFDITKNGKKKNFNWVANMSVEDLGEVFQEAAKQKQEELKKFDGTNSISLGENEVLKASMKLADSDVDLSFNARYQKYKGKLYDPKKREYTNDVIDTLLPFKTQDDNIHLFNNIAGVTENLRLSTDSRLTAENIKEALDKKKQKIDTYYTTLLNRAEMPAGLEGELLSTTMPIGPELLRDSGKPSDLPVFVKNLGNKKDTLIGPQLVASLKKQAGSAGDAAKKIADGDKFVRGGGVADDALATTTKGLTKAALQLFGKYNFVRGVSGFLGRNIGGVPRNSNIKDPESAKQAAGFISNVFGQVGGAANAAFGKSRNGRMAQFAKSAYILASGAWQAFGGIAKGDTGLLQNFISAADDDGNISAAYAEGLFRSLGGGAALDAVKNYKLPNEYKDLLGKAKGGRIATVGNNGELTYQPLTDAIPNDVAGLMDLIFNPYNEFPNVHVRYNLIEKFQKDLNSLKGGNNLPFFDPQTSGFVNEGLSRLKVWYHGDGSGNVNDAWWGQDYLFAEKFPDGEDQDTPIFRRAKILAQQIASGKSNYKEASEANAAFGITNKFGNLPDAQWMLNRGRLGRQVVEPDKKARGGMIYASNGQMINFQPRGTDTVPAMLTPGEFVVNRQATQANLPLLKSINNGNANAMSRGGTVYAEDGGMIPDEVGKTGPFTSNDGKKIIAKLIATGGSTVKIYMNNREYEVPYERFDTATRSAMETARRKGIISGSMKRGEGGESAVNRILDMKNSNKLEEILTNDQALKKYAPNGISFMQKDIGNPQKWSPYTYQEREYRESKGRQAWYIDPAFDPQMSRKNLLPYSYEGTRPDYKKIYDSNGNMIGIGYVARTTDKEAILHMNDRTQRTVPLSQLSASDRRAAETKQSWSDHMSNTGDLGMSGRPTGQMLPVPGHLLNFQSNPTMFGNAAGTARREGRILQVGSNGVIMESLAGSNRGQSGFISYDELDSKGRGIAYELYEAAKNGQNVQSGRDHRALRERTSRMFPMGTTDEQFNAMNNSMSDQELRETYKRIAEKKQATRQEEKDAAAKARHDALMEKSYKTIGLGHAAMTSYSPGMLLAYQDTYMQASLADRIVARARQESISAADFSNWHDENYSKRGTAYELAYAALHDMYTVGPMVADMADFYRGPLLASARKQSGPRVPPTEQAVERQQERDKKKAAGKSAMKKRLNDLYQKFRERHGEERAKQLMFERGYAEPQYLNEGGGVKDLVTAGASALQNVGTKRGNPFTARNIGYGMGGHTGALIGEAGEIIGEGLYHGAQHGMKAGMTSAVAGYGAMVAADFVGEAASLALDPEAAGKRYESANRRQTNQGYLSNVGENLMNPGRAIMQLGQETAGLVGDLMKNRQDATKRNPAASPGRRAQRRQFGGLIYADAGMMVPRGTDTVPAMLTPGEFVVNRQAAQSNLPLLKSINSGVSYFKNGGEAEKGAFDKKKADAAAAKQQEDERLQRMKEQEKQANAQAKDIAREQQIPLQQAYQQALQEIRSQDPLTGGSSGAAPAGGGASNSQAQMPQISQQQQAMTAQASQAAFDPRNSGDVNKQLAIFGQVLTGVNQVLVQYGTIIQGLVAAQGQQTQQGEAGQGQGENGGVSNGNGGIAEYTQKFGEFVQSLQKINIPEQINLVGKHDVNVNVAGGKELNQAMRGPMGDYIIKRVNEGLAKWVSKNFDDVSDPQI